MGAYAVHNRYHERLEPLVQRPRAPHENVFHNHPSGDPTPSREDVGITRQVREGGELLGIKVLDHLTDPQLQVLGQETLFNGTPFWLGILGPAYASAADGRFLMVRHRDPADPPDRLQVVLNFSERLKSLAAGPR